MLAACLGCVGELGAEGDVLLEAARVPDLARLVVGGRHEEGAVWRDRDAVDGPLVLGQVRHQHAARLPRRAARQISCPGTRALSVSLQHDILPHEQLRRGPQDVTSFSGVQKLKGAPLKLSLSWACQPAMSNSLIGERGKGAILPVGAPA